MYKRRTLVLSNLQSEGLLMELDAATEEAHTEHQ